MIGKPLETKGCITNCIIRLMAINLLYVSEHLNSAYHGWGVGFSFEALRCTKNVWCYIQLSQLIIARKHIHEKTAEKSNIIVEVT